jgi:CubicO group peptidase (beta-lactamase class C family)
MMIYKKTLFLLGCIVLLIFTSQKNLYGQDKASQIDHLMKAYQELEQFNGTVLVAEKGEVIFKKGYGLANMEWDIPNAPDTKMRLGSITKQFTSMLIMQLVEDGKIDLQAKMTKYLPDYRSETGKKVTIHHLLTHTSGIPSYTELTGFFSEISRDPYAVDVFIGKFCSGDLEFEPGTQFRYNNSGYYLLGAIIEKVSGLSYEDALHKHILEPLGMESTGYDHHGAILKNRATGYSKTPGGYINSPYLDMGLPYAAGSLYSTVEDLYLWDRALYTKQLLSEKYKQIMYTPFLDRYAYGWAVGKVVAGASKDSLNFVAHGGGINGFNTLISRLVDDQHLVVLLNNTGGANLNSMDRNIRNILYGFPYELPKKSIASELYEKLKEVDLTSAIAYYHNLKENNPTDYDFNESELNVLGYRLMSENRLDEAIGLFQLNVEMFTQSSNVYDSLGEAYMKNGQNEYAIKNYQRSLDLDPNNTNAKEMLNKLKKL